MLKRLTILAAALAALSPFSHSATAQVQFIATLQEISTAEGGMTALTVELTPSISVPVLVNDDTEIRDENDLPASLADLAPGMVLKIRGVFAAGGILAQEIEIKEDDSEFEIRGRIQQVSSDGAGGGSIRVAGFEIQVPADTVIEGREGGRLGFADLAPGQLAKVEGALRDGQLVASHISTRRLGDDFARIRLEGVVSAILSEFEFTVELEGGVPAQVEIDEHTEVRGSLAVGALVRVEGILTETLSVLARRIVVVDSVRLAPRRLRMGLNEIREVSVILLAPRDADTVFALSSSHPDVASPTVESLTLPAGELTAVFEVASGAVEGEAVIGVATEGFRGRVAVEVEDGDEEEEEDDGPPMTALRLLWEPRVIHAAPQGSREVRLRINERAPMDIPVAITLEKGDEDFVLHPEMVVIPEGSKEARLELSFLKDQGEAVLRAVLPEEFGGDAAELEISLRPVKGQKVKLEWSPDEVKTRPGETFRVQLLLDRPAPYDLDAVLSVKTGNRSLLSGLPARLEFAPGETAAILVLTAGDHPGKIKLRAALPLQAGGEQAELQIEVRK